MSLTDSLRARVPTRGATEVVADTHDWLSELLLFLPLISVTLLSTLAIPLTSSKQVSFGIPVIGLCTAVGILSGRMWLNANAIFYVVMVSGLFLLQVFTGNALNHNWSMGSLGLLMVLHAPYCFSMPPGATRPNIQLEFFQWVAAFMGLCGVLQFGLQFVVSTSYAFPLEYYMPNNIVMEDFHSLIPLSFGSSIYKSNGIFMLEPSFYSQILCIGVLIELTMRRRIIFLGCFAAGLVVAYSGTGFMILGAALPVWIIRERKFGLVIAGMIGAVILYLVAADALHLDVYVKRLSELNVSSSGEKDTSAHMRFIAGFSVLDQYVWDSLKDTLFGMGAGTYRNYATKSRVLAWDPSYIKLVFEYGFIGAGLYFAFLIRAVVNTTHSIYLKIGMLAQYIVINSTLHSQPHSLGLALMIWGSTKWPAEEEAGLKPKPAVAASPKTAA
jgi:hypothetical protein